jgi:hypothetical protein
VRLYRGRATDDALLDGSSYARQDVSEYATPVTIDPGLALIAVWDSGTPGETGTITITAQDIPA